MLIRFDVRGAVMEAVKKAVTVELTEEEYKDLEDFCKHHPDEAKNPGEALKKMAGLRMYRQMKKKVDKERKKPSVVAYLPQELGIPTWIPCVLSEQIDAFGMTYHEYIETAIRIGGHLVERALKGDKRAKAELVRFLKETGIAVPICFKEE